MNEVWNAHKGEDLRQGDILADCAIAIVPDQFSLESVEDELLVESRRLIVVTQSCDLANGKAPYVAMCPVQKLDEMERADARFQSRGRWEEVRRGKIEGLYMLPSSVDVTNNRDVYVVDFRMIVSLPIGYLSRHADSLGARPRLCSPYVEHFSQSFARFFMRVGLPSQIPAFN